MYLTYPRRITHPSITHDRDLLSNIPTCMSLFHAWPLLFTACLWWELTPQVLNLINICETCKSKGQHYLYT